MANPVATIPEPKAQDVDAGAAEDGVAELDSRENVEVPVGAPAAGTQQGGQGCCGFVSRHKKRVIIGILTIVALAIILVPTLLKVLGDRTGTPAPVIGPATQYTCVVYLEPATLTSEGTETRGTSTEGTVSLEGPGISGGYETQSVTKGGITSSVAVIGKVSTADRARCLEEYRQCKGYVPFVGAEGECEEDGIYVTQGEPPGAAEDVSLRESCWDLSSGSGLVNASDVVTIYVNQNVAGLVAANPTLEGKCGEDAVLPTGEVVCLNPKTENICQVERV